MSEAIDIDAMNDENEEYEVNPIRSTKKTRKQITRNSFRTLKHTLALCQVWKKKYKIRDLGKPSLTLS